MKIKELRQQILQKAKQPKIVSTASSTAPLHLQQVSQSYGESREQKAVNTDSMGEAFLHIMNLSQF